MPGAMGLAGPAGPQGAAGADATAPSGAVVAFAGVAPPANWLLCNGSAVSRMTYAALFSVIGTLHGSGDGVTTFNLPDYRGTFLRGTDNGRGEDPDRATRTAMAAGGSTGDKVGSVEGQAFLSHNHAMNDPGHLHAQNVTANPGACPGSSIIRDDWAGDVSGACAYAQGVNTVAAGTGITLGAAGGNETRPFNANVNWIIRQ